MSVLNKPHKTFGSVKLVYVVAEAIRDCKEAGIPSGVLYSALMQYGCNLEMYESIIRTLKNTGLIKEELNCLYWIQKSA